MRIQRTHYLYYALETGLIHEFASLFRHKSDVIMWFIVLLRNPICTAFPAASQPEIGRRGHVIAASRGRIVTCKRPRADIAPDRPVSRMHPPHAGGPRAPAVSPKPHRPGIDSDIDLGIRQPTRRCDPGVCGRFRALPPLPLRSAARACPHAFRTHRVASKRGRQRGRLC